MAHDVNQCEMDVAAQVRSALVDRISSERYELWITHGTTWSYQHGTLCVEFPSDFACQLAKRMLGREIAETAQEVFGFSPEIVFAAAAATRAAPAESVPAANVAAAKVPAAKVAAANLPLAKLSAAPLPVRRGESGNPSNAAPFEANHASIRIEADGQLAADELTVRPLVIPNLWERFVQGASNQLAWTTANLVVAEPGRLTPFVLYGPSGCGKSYLAAAMAERLRTVKRLRRVVHMSSEQFTNDYMEGLRGSGLPMFRRKYRDVEALILDDIQFLEGKKSTIGELKHTLDNLLKLGKQIVLTADRSLAELQSLGSDFVGRLHGGMVTPVYPLDQTTRTELLCRLVDGAKLPVDRQITEQIASRATGDGRVLSGIAKRLTAVAALHGRQLTWEECWEAVHDLVHATQPVVRIADIERAVCRMFGLEPDSLQSDNKARSISQPRMLAMFLSRKYTPAAYKEIGEYFGKRRHSTVISAEKTVEGWLSDGSSLRLGRGLTVRDAIRQVEAQLQVG